MPLRAAPAWETFGDRTHFTCLRGLRVENGRIVGVTEEFDRFTRTQEFGDVTWPSYPILFTKNLGELADGIRRPDLYPFDVWG